MIPTGNATIKTTIVFINLSQGYTYEDGPLPDGDLPNKDLNHSGGWGINGAYI